MSKNIIIKQKEGDIFTELYPRTKMGLVMSDDGTKNLKNIINEINDNINSISKASNDLGISITNINNTVSEIKIQTDEIPLIKVQSTNTANEIIKVKEEVLNKLGGVSFNVSSTGILQITYDDGSEL